MRPIIFALALMMAACGFVQAQVFDTPEALLEAFYAPYFSQEFSDDDSAFRSKALQELYETDAAATPEGGLGALDFDPYIAGQDWDLTDFWIGPAQIVGDTARVVVSFKNFGEADTLTYDLVLEDGGWKIDDLSGVGALGEYRLSEIFAGARYGADEEVLEEFPED